MSDQQEAAPSAVQVLESAMRANDAALNSETKLPEVTLADNLQTETAEAAPAEAVPEQLEAKKPEDLTASKFAALSRKERQIRQTEKAIKAQQVQIAEQMKQLEAFKKQQDEFEQTWQQNPYEAMKKRGVDFKTLTEKYVLDEPETPEQKQNDYMKKLEAKLEAFENQLKQKEELSQKQQEEAAARQADQAKANYLGELTEFVNKNSDKYELIARNDAVGLIYQVMDEVYRASIDPGTGDSEYKTPTDYERLRDRAADEVENHFLEEAKSLIETNSLKKLLGAQKAPTPEPKKTTQTQTLSNTLSQQVPSKSENFLSDDESKRKISAMIKWHE